MSRRASRGRSVVWLTATLTALSQRPSLDIGSRPSAGAAAEVAHRAARTTRNALPRTGLSVSIRLRDRSNDTTARAWHVILTRVSSSTVAPLLTEAQLARVEILAALALESCEPVTNRHLPANDRHFMLNLPWSGI